MLREKFLSYVERQRAANETKIMLGANNKITIAEYEKANELKREFLNMLEELEKEE